MERLNALLAKHPVTPYIAGHDSTGPDRWHMHVADRESSVSELLIAESLMGLSTLVCDLGATRLGVCDASPVHPRLRGHLAEPVPPLLLGPVLLARQRRGLPRPAESGSRCHERRTR